MRILLVDDQPRTRYVLAGWLAAFMDKVTVESAASAGEALRAIQDARPDVVIATHPLLDVDGVAFVRHVKLQPDPPTLVIMFNSGDPKLEADCAAAGADYCVDKVNLRERLTEFLKQRFPVAGPAGSFI
jgi:CheY-like chemotaxis protein